MTPRAGLAAGAPANASIMKSTSLILFLAAALSPVASGGPRGLPKPAPVRAGGIEGTVTTGVKLATKGSVSQKDLVVYLVPKVHKEFPAPAEKAKVVQRKLNFEPHVLPILAGTTVDFVNEDAVVHNVFLESDCCPLDFDTDRGQQKAATFGKPGAYAIVCRLHPEMSMHVIALETPHFVRTEFAKNKGEDGAATYTASFRLEGVPPGEYVLKTWHKKLKPIEQAVVVAADRVEKVELQAGK
jgi:plastocyanin